MNFSLLAMSIVFMIMAGVALFFSFLLRAKSRALRTLPNDLKAQVFDKTFNVFDPNIKHRRIINSHTALICFTVIYGVWVGLWFVVIKTLEMGGLLGSIAFLVCGALLMTDETQELSKNAGIFAKAVNNHVALGKGDMEVLQLMRKTLPRLSAYQMALASTFFACALTVPLLVDGIFFAITGGAAAIFAVAAATFWVFPPYTIGLLALVFGAAFVTTQVTVVNIRKKIFGFPSPVPLEMSDMGLQHELMSIYCLSRHHPTLREPVPENTEKMCKKELEEHSKE